MKTLHLTLKKKWFTMILNGEKKEEYREIKPYWTKRLISINEIKPPKDNESWFTCERIPHLNKYDYIKFTNGYAKNAPTFTIECKGITIGDTQPQWCDDWRAPVFHPYGITKPVFVKKLGKIVNQKNIK